MQASSTDSVFVFVEGAPDSFFYSTLAVNVFEPSYRVHVRAARELPVKAQGKAGCLEFFRRLRAGNALMISFKGVRLAAIFHVDKDVDDQLRSQLRSKHLIYTEAYELENHLFISGDLAKAAAAASNLPFNLVRDHLGDFKTWRDRVAGDWKDWVVLCLAGRVTRASCGVTYRRTSRVNPGFFGVTDVSALQACESELLTAAQLGTVEGNSLLRRLRKRVERYFREDRYDVVYKGKWYATRLADQVRRLGVLNPPFTSNNLEEVIPQMLAMTVDYAGPSVEYFRRRLLAIRDMIDALPTGN
jgi:hypothetical protein